MYYASLEVELDADHAALRRAYRTQALRWHPDKHPDTSTREEAEARFKQVAQAWAVLGDEAKRAAYDSRLRLGLDDANPSGGATTVGDRNNYSWETSWSDLAEEERAFEEQERRFRQDWDSHRHAWGRREQVQRTFLRRLGLGIVVAACAIIFLSVGLSESYAKMALSISAKLT